MKWDKIKSVYEMKESENELPDNTPLYYTV
jgi:hypothetical protein